MLQRPRRLILFAAAILAVIVLGLAALIYTPDRPRAELNVGYLAAPGDMREVSGIRLHVRDTGPRDAPALVLLHGFGASLHTWEPWAVALSRQYRVIRLDLPGFGLTGPDPTGDYSDARFNQILTALLDQLGVARATLIGNSLGGRLAWMFFGVCALYILVAVVLPLAALIFTSLERFATVILSQAEFTLANYETALSLGPVRVALGNSLMLGFGVATVGVVLMAFLVWIIYRSRIVGRGVIEYLVMFPQAVPRLVFGLALLWAWINMPVSIYGTLWLLAIAYLTVMLPLGVRTLAGVVLQIDKSLEECARVCGAGWLYQMRTVTLPLLKPGILAAWLLIFMACVRELGVSVFLMGPNAKVIAPSIVAAFASSGTELTAAMALIQTATVIVALMILFRLSRGATKELM